MNEEELEKYLIGKKKRIMALGNFFLWKIWAEKKTGKKVQINPPKEPQGSPIKRKRFR
jgi:hypothetical protein